MKYLKHIFIPFMVISIAPISAYCSIERTYEDDKGIFSLVFENDVFSGTDNNYTNGLRLGWLSSESQVPEFAKKASDKLMPLSAGGNKRISFAIGQNIYTPSNKTSQDLVVGDRPYAGWLYGSAGIVADTPNSLDTMVITLGMVGPSSQAEGAQKFIHRSMGSSSPKGWNNQLHDEPGVILTYDHKWRNMYQVSSHGIGFDATPSMGFNLGNINTDASIGGMLRLGYDLPTDYGPPRILPSLPGSDYFVPTKQLSGYLFAGLDCKAVARNIFLDGNTFEDSASVNKEVLVGSAQVGVAMVYHQLRVSYTQIYMTKEYTTQQKGENFGAVTVSYRF
jgi:lipid A 3-O-deacylase